VNDKFPDNFLWGAAASGPQLEGAGSVGGKALTVWDYWFKLEPEKFYQQIGPEVTSNFYDQYKEDILSMKDTGFNSFRTSISWARLLPDGETINQEAVFFYRDVFTRLRENGIEPIVNLYHFDMPYRLYIKGGWENPEVVEEFKEYAQVSFDCFGDLVSRWVTFNEPIVPIEMGYLNDKHLPSVNNITKAMQAGYYTLLAHVKAVNAFRQSKQQGEIGIILNLTPSYPKSEQDEDKKAANWADVLFNRSFLDPVVLGHYPAEIKELIQNENIDIQYTEEELDLIKSNTVDFLGVNYYQPRRIQASRNEQVDSERILERYFQPYQWPEAKMNPHRGWEIYEKGLYDIAINIHDNYLNIPWYVAENGIGVEGEERFMDRNGEVQDNYRIEFMEDHLTWLNKGISEGSNCFGYHVWTFLDNWSWLNEYKNRYGLFRFNLETQKRIKKKSAFWFKQLAETNQFPTKW
jgi:6-phospho-beta-glucosidase